jgi:hypothetical protein
MDVIYGILFYVRLECPTSLDFLEQSRSRIDVFPASLRRPAREQIRQVIGAATDIRFQLALESRRHRQVRIGLVRPGPWNVNHLGFEIGVGSQQTIDLVHPNPECCI